MAGPFSVNGFSHFVQLETVVGTSPGALAGADAFICQTEMPFKQVLARRKRTKDRDGTTSVTSVQLGRRKCTWSVNGDVIPSGNASTPTEPDMDVFFEAHMGTKHKATAHTTLAAGSTTTLLNFTPGGVAASGVQVGDIIVVDVSATFGLEARQITIIATDAVTVDRALSAAPATGRAVTVGTTYRFNPAVIKTLHLWQFLSGDNFRHKAGGCIPKNLEIGINGSDATPTSTVTVSGEGFNITPGVTARPTPVTAGIPHEPTEAKAWVGTTLQCLTSMNLKSDNGVVLRETEFCTLIPTGVKRTDNDGKLSATLTFELLLQTAWESYFDNAGVLTEYDLMFQLGIAPGKIVAIRIPRFAPDVQPGNVGDEVSLQLSGDCLATTAQSDEFTLFFG